MTLANFDERRGGYFSRLPLIARGELPESWEYGVRFDETSADKHLDVLYLRDHHNARLGFGLTTGAEPRGSATR